MSSRFPRAYRFGTLEQWQACLLHRLEHGKGGPTPIPPMARKATPLGLGQPFSRVAVDPWGEVWWRREATDGTRGGLMRTGVDGSCGPYAIDATLARSRRWVADRRGLWAFEETRPIIRRYDRDTLRRRLEIDLRRVSEGDEAEGPGPLVILDMASDGRDGVWLLVRHREGGSTLRHLDCEGRPGKSHPVPCVATPPREIGGVGGRQLRLVLLSAGGEQLVFVSPETGSSTGTMGLGSLAPCWRTLRMTTDTRNRIALWGRHERRPSGGDDPVAGLVVLDGTGGCIHGPIHPFTDDDQVSSGGTDKEHVSLADLAIDADTLWLGTSEGAWRLAPGGEAAGRETPPCTVITPRLESPERDLARGWLRAELKLDLPPGAVLEADFVTTNDGRVAASLDHLAGDTSVGVQARQAGIWNTLEPKPSRLFRIAGPTKRQRPVSIPLFDSTDRWLWLRLRFFLPEVEGFHLEELRVLYPEVSISRHLPAIFMKDENPAGFLRRFLGVLESTTQDLDERIQAIGSHVDPDTAPDEWLDYVARWLGLPWEDALPVAAKRCLLQHAGELIDRRATRSGLEQLLRCLLGAEAAARIVDVSVDFPPLRLGGGGRSGGSLPALLAGAPHRAATLGGKAVLGRACLGPAGDSLLADPLIHLVPTVRVEITAPGGFRRERETLLARVVGQYLPAGVRLSLRWRTGQGARREMGARLPLTLTGRGPAVSGSDSVGRAAVGGAALIRLDECGHGMGSRLK